jgi:nucleoside-diphosphate-sugar epimerase
MLAPFLPAATHPKAEKLAWSLAKEHKLDLVTILPNFVLGPALSAALPDSTSVGFLKGWLEGNASKGSITYAPDVRDVARAHILAATTPSAAGRYIVSEAASASPAFISATLRERFPQYDIPVGDEEPSETTIDNSKAARELGLQLTPLAVTLVDMAVTLIALGVATPKLR